MRVFITTVLISTITLTACSGWRDSGVNPRNWFGGSSSDLVEASTPGQRPANPSDRQTGNPLIEDDDAEILVRRNQTSLQRSGILARRNRVVVYEGTLVDQITDLDIERIPTGAIVKVTGLPQREGAFDVRLLRVNEDGPINGVMEYTLNAIQPINQPVGIERTREVKAGAFLTNGELAEIQEIRVRGELNIRSTKR